MYVRADAERSLSKMPAHFLLDASNRAISMHDRSLYTLSFVRTSWTRCCKLPKGAVAEGMGTNQLYRIVVGISSQIGRDGHRDMGDVSTYGKIIRKLLGSMKPAGSDFCTDTRRYKYLRASQRVKTERDMHWVERGLTFWIFGSNPTI